MKLNLWAKRSWESAARGTNLSVGARLLLWVFRLGYRPNGFTAVLAGIRSRERRTADAGDHLDVEDLFHTTQKLEMRDQPARRQVHDADTALELRPPGRDRHPPECRGL